MRYIGKVAGEGFHPSRNVCVAGNPPRRGQDPSLRYAIKRHPTRDSLLSPKTAPLRAASVRPGVGPRFPAGRGCSPASVCQTRVRERARQNAHHIIEVAVGGHGNCKQIAVLYNSTIRNRPHGIPVGGGAGPGRAECGKSCVPMNCAAAACMAARSSAAPTLWQVS